MDDLPIRSAIRRQIKALNDLDGAVEAIGGMVGRSQLQRCADINGADRISVAVAVALDEAAGQPEIIRAAAIALGYRLVPLDAVATSADAVRAVGAIAAGTGGLVASVIEKAADGSFNRRETADLLREIGEQESGLAALRAAVVGGVA